MPIFRYRAKNQHGETVNGKVEARNEAQAAALLQSRGLFVIGVNSTSESSFSFINDFFQGIKQDEVVNITRQLSTMVTAGLPLLDGLRILEQQSKPAIAKLIAELIRDIEGGGTFADALSKHPKVFDRVFIQLVRAGEAGGVLDEILNRLADNLERSKEFRSKTKGALIYPTIVMIAMGLVGAVMMIFVIPKLTEMYKDFGADLPFATQLLIGISNFFVNFWWLMLAMIFGGIAGVNSWGKTKKGRLFLDGMKLKMPIMGVLRAKILLTEFARTMSLLLSAGISLLRALEIVTEALDNVIYRDALKAASEQVEKGVSLGDAISAHNTIFPPILFQMISVGEETGKLDEVLMKLANYFQSESEQAIKNLTTALEPLIMVVLGLMVGVMVIAIIMPIYNLTSQF
jgi:type II secretory pathway component PulF